MTLRRSCRRYAEAALGLALLSAAASACASAHRAADAPAAPGPAGGPRFGPAGDLTFVAIRDLPPAGRRPAAPRYPDAAKARGDEAAFAVAFVVDTLGAVEYRTVSFLGLAPTVPVSAGATAQFEAAACEALRRQRFRPAGGAAGHPRRRVLTVTSFVFAVGGGQLFDYQVDLAPYEQALAAALADGSLARQLEGAPHCP